MAVCPGSGVHPAVAAFRRLPSSFGRVRHSKWSATRSVHLPIFRLHHRLPSKRKRTPASRHLRPLRNLRHLLQLEAEDFARRWEMLGNASQEENGEVWAGAPVTAARWAEVRGMVTSAIKMGERACGWRGNGFVVIFKRGTIRSILWGMIGT